ncbi:Somatostatin receptor type 5 [Fasciola gigantica]|uniref:Somatostatin receptor type 5 n=1 Tax=Fasciola gigantica TaxID=46835 RepID=A0A504Y779_FASGI|nr:Somatostatin receptor type 5 [Fasciola gigantica]
MQLTVSIHFPCSRELRAAQSGLSVQLSFLVAVFVLIRFMSSVNETSVRGCRDGYTSEEVMVNEFRAYVSPFLAAVGIPTNILTMIVFGILQYLKPCRFNLYAMWLVPAYNIQLITNCLLDDFFGRGLKWATNCRYWINFDTISSFNCKLLTFLSESSALVKSFVMMYFSADRVFSAYCPTCVPVGGALWYARGGILLCYFVGLLLNTPHLFFVDRTTDDGKTSCSYIDPLSTGVQYVLYLYIIGSTLTPAIFIFITNVFILFKMWFVLKISAKRGKPSHQASVELSKMVAHLVLSVLFQLLSFPLVVVILLRQQVYSFGYNITQPEYANKIIQLSKLFSSIDCINYSFEFFIFLIFMPEFRRTLWNLCICSKDTFQSESVEWFSNSSSVEKTTSSKTNCPNLCSVKEISNEFKPTGPHALSATGTEREDSVVIMTRL